MDVWVWVTKERNTLSSYQPDRRLIFSCWFLHPKPDAVAHPIVALRQAIDKMTLSHDPSSSNSMRKLAHNVLFLIKASRSACKIVSALHTQMVVTLPAVSHLTDSWESRICVSGHRLPSHRFNGGRRNLRVRDGKWVFARGCGVKIDGCVCGWLFKNELHVDRSAERFIRPDRADRMVYSAIALHCRLKVDQL